MGNKKFYCHVMVVAFNATRNQSEVLVSSYDKRDFECSCSNIFQSGERYTEIRLEATNPWTNPR
jgi:hypothetical protein